MPASRILFFARARRLLIAAGDIRNADAIVFASTPSTTCNISGVRIPAPSAGGGAPPCFTLRDLGGEDRELVPPFVADMPMARAIDRPAARNRHQPRFGIRGAAALGAVRERGR